MTIKVHPSAFVDEGATIGQGSHVWHFTHVCAGAVIGRSVILGQGVFVGGAAKIGHRCKIQNNVSVFDNVEIEDDVFCGPSVVFTNVKNPRALISRKAEYGKTLVRTKATIGANATIVSGVTVGRSAFVAAGAVVTKDVADFSLVQGVPARQVGWMSDYGEQIPLPVDGEGEYECPKTKVIYRLSGGVMVCS